MFGYAMPRWLVNKTVYENCAYYHSIRAHDDELCPLPPGAVRGNREGGER